MQGKMNASQNPTRETKALRARLAEAEDALRAIRSGEVDALVVAGPGGDRVFTLRSADHLYRMFVEAMNEGAVTLSDDALILFCNRAFAGIVQTPADQVIGASFESFVEPADRPAFQELLHGAGTRDSVGEITARAANHATVPLRLSLTRLRDIDADVVCMVATDMTESRRREEELRRAHDELEQRVAERTASLAVTLQKLELARTEALDTMEDAVEARRAVEVINQELRQHIAQRKQAEKNLEQGLSLLRATLESTADGILVVDHEGKTVSFNQTFARLWRIPESILAAGEDRQLLAYVLNQLKDPDGFLSKVKALYAQPDAESFDILEFIDGRTFERFSKPQRTGGEAIGRVWSFRDVTKRRQAEERLRESEDRYRRLFESNPHPMWVYDVATLRFLAVNDAAIHHYGFSRDEFLSMTIEGLSLPQAAPPPGGHPPARPLERADPQGVCRHARKDGVVIDVDLTSHALDFDGRDSRLVLALDITERKKMDDLVRHSLREKESLLREVHHRVKNNLQVITSLLRMESRRSDHSATRTALQEMRNRIMAMAALHESLYRSGTFAAVDLGAYLSQLSNQSFRALVTRPGAVELRVDTASVQVEMDEALPCGLLVNELISNCLKHGFPGNHTGEVRVELKPVNGGQMCLRVSDNGVGLPPDFEARREHSLGLQLVSSLSRQIGGRLEIGTRPGASFAVTFAPKRAGLSP